MAFGFSPKYTKRTQLDGMDKEHFLAIAVESARKLGWEVSFISTT